MFPRRTLSHSALFKRAEPRRAAARLPPQRHTSPCLKHYILIPEHGAVTPKPRGSRSSRSSRSRAQHNRCRSEQGFLFFTSLFFTFSFIRPIGKQPTLYCPALRALRLQDYILLLLF